LQKLYAKLKVRTLLGLLEVLNVSDSYSCCWGRYCSWR